MQDSPGSSRQRIDHSPRQFRVGLAVLLAGFALTVSTASEAQVGNSQPLFSAGAVPPAQRGATTYVFSIDGTLKPLQVREPEDTGVQLIPAHRSVDGHPPLPVRRSEAMRGRTASVIAVTTEQLAQMRRDAVSGRAGHVARAHGSLAKQTVREDRPAHRAPRLIQPGSGPAERLPERVASTMAPSADREQNKAGEDTKSDAGTAAWPADVVAAERAACAVVIAETGARIRVIDPIKDGQCGAPAPVMLYGFDGQKPVELSKPARLTCGMVGALKRWIDDGLQPAAERHLGARIARINVMSGYSCRNVYGRRDAKLSQHALANALDIAGFSTTSGKRANLLAHWGLTQRDIAARAKAEAARIAAEQAAAEKAALAQAGKVTPVGAGQPTNVAEASTARDGDTRANLAPPSRLGGPKKPGTNGLEGEAEEGTAAGKPASRSQRRFLRAAFTSACEIFGTVLGPEANEAHRNHFHVDLAPRRRSNYCE